MVNETELQFINKLMKENILLFKTKLTIDKLTDPFAKTMFFEISKALREYGELIPSKHLNALINDEDRMKNYKKLKYPLELTSVKGIMDYINKYDTDIKFETLERTIIDNYIKTEMRYLAEEMSEDIEDSKKTIKDVIRKYSYNLDMLKYDNEEKISFMSANDIIEEEKKRLANDEEVVYTKTGFNFIDHIAGGITAPSTIYLVAPSGSGKSIWLYDSTVRALREGRRVLFATIEIPAKEAYLKILANFSGVKYHTILKKSFTPSEKQKYLKALEEFEKLKDNLYIIYDETGLSPDDIKHYYKQLEKVGIKCDYICIDYLGLLKSSIPNQSEGDRYAGLPKQIRILSQETNSIILIPHQMKVQQATKDIEDIKPDGIYYAMPLMHESTLAYFMTRKKEDGEDLTFVKSFKSRIGEPRGTFVFKNANRDLCNLGIDELYEGNNENW